MRISCHTLFDCSFTATTGHYKPSQVPFLDRAGQTIQNQSDWNRSRNQQRNWETLLQIISLRSQPVDIVYPRRSDNAWHFEFKIEAEAVYDQDLTELYRDCTGVPMINVSGTDIQPLLTTSGSTQNIWFQLVNI